MESKAKRKNYMKNSKKTNQTVWNNLMIAQYLHCREPISIQIHSIIITEQLRQTRLDKKTILNTDVIKNYSCKR